MQILQGRQAHTDLPLLHATKVQMGINHTPWPTAESLHVKDKLLSSPTHDIPICQYVMYRELNDKRWYPTIVIQQLLGKKNASTLKTLYTREENRASELYKKDNNQNIDTNQGVNNNQRHKHSIKPPNRLNL